MCPILQQNLEDSLTEAKEGENVKEGVGYHGWHLPREVELREGCCHKDDSHWCPLRVQFWEVVGHEA